ncbi:hypothetical protein [Lactobacillus gallinarum]|uniref:hypothetical protein n=1 Tax=Lactobacillus gallinarum TaxID=52242 RepID=UPI00388DCE73
MSGLIAIIAAVLLIVYAIQHDKKSTDNKWLKDWGFWVITAVILVAGVFSLNDSSPSSVFAVVMFLALLGLLYWRITDRSKKDLHGKKRVLHTLITGFLVVFWLFLTSFVSSSISPDDHTTYIPAHSKTSKEEKRNYIRLDGEKIYYTSSKKYSLNQTDDSWSAATAKVNNVTVYKTEEGYTYGSKRGRKEIQGMLTINVTVKALKDIEVSMDSATVSIPNINEQHDIETKEDWDDLDKGISKTGTLYVPIYKLHKTNSIKSLRLKFGCQQQNSDDPDDFDHDYDMTLNLN